MRRVSIVICLFAFFVFIRLSFGANHTTLIHGRFTPLQDKITMVKSWPGINPADVDAAVRRARRDGTVALFEKKSPKNDLLDIVIVVNRSDVSQTIVYARERLKEVWGRRYVEWEEVYSGKGKEFEVISGAKFYPNRIEVKVVDLSANRNKISSDFWSYFKTGVLDQVQSNQSDKLATFLPIFCAIESPGWVEQMDGKTVPNVLLSGIVFRHIPYIDNRQKELSVKKQNPDSPQFYSPSIWFSRDLKINLDGERISNDYYTYSFPVDL
ncbi:hypothetical protein CO172_03000 [Candidatus Uhrbacteria bacterium CG_4_9_14_3_um_filter_36_7]|uniref:Uncharacterized protein n=1 Tax=Candidatus Uhrbacteria bacterium CG_4_9_14_3_um_filter_36_7 TaxID=1975033 RepID=A0A2M7XGX6_9BACT|nr:MAG: hypothetical protein CO172_03000 [Candidatus Uhrbacteria bacterium CG_4_9_14_3_um_filter_36_7]